MKKKSLKLLADFCSENATLVGVIILGMISFLFVRGFKSGYNMRVLISSIAPLAVVACGVTLPVLNGGTDFSSASVVTLGSVIGAYLVVKTPLAHSVWGTWVGISLILLLSLTIGMVNGFAVIGLKMPSFIATMAMQMIAQGAAVLFASIYYEKTSLNGLPKAFLALGGGNGSSILIPLLIMGVIVGFTQWLLRCTQFGRQIYAVGTNQKAAFISGVRIKKIIFILSSLSGLYAGIGAIMYTAKNEAGIPTMGDKLFIDIIASIIIGGTSVNGGKGGVHKTMFGVIFIVLMDNVLNLLGTTWYLITLIKGALIMILVMFGSSSIPMPGFLKLKKSVTE